jgi:FAD:protein FMN transferase
MAEMSRPALFSVGGFRLDKCRAVLLGWLLFVWPLTDRAHADGEGFKFHHDGVLGTSLDLQVNTADAQQAALVETTILAEIERLRKILSTYDPASDVSRVNAAMAPVAVSPELLEVLGFYDFWTLRSKGAYNGHLGELIGTWRAAEKAGAPPTPAVLAPIVRALAQPGWKLDTTARTVARLTSGTLDINSLGKGYIISKAVVAARAKAPGTQGLLLNIGGDLFASGVAGPATPWTIGVADPMHNEDNAPPLTQVRLSDRAISTSAAYERGYTFGGKHYSHILDPRTGYPAAGAASATVITANSANGNALATTLCVLKPEEGLALAGQIPDTDCLIVGMDGKQYRSPRFARYEIAQPAVAGTSPPSSPPATPAPAAPAGTWPAKYQVTISINLKTPSGANAQKIRKPYMAVWVEDANSKRVRTVAVWGRQPKYLPDLSTWWNVAKDDQQWAMSVTKATRAAGQYKLAWDGLDDQAKPLPTGTYTIFLEVNRQFGTHATESGQIVCNRIPAQGTIPAGSEFGQATLSFGPSS